MHNSDAISILNCGLNSPCFFYVGGAEMILGGINESKTSAANSSMFVFQVAFWGLNLAQSTENVLFMVASCREMSVRVRKGDFMVLMNRSFYVLRFGWSGVFYTRA